jgi:signal transduction histidine kinase
MVTLAIRDAGRGISEQVLEHFQETGAAGIGLAGMRERIADLGGELHIQSNNKGTLLTATVPLRAVPANSAPQESVA